MINDGLLQKVLDYGVRVEFDTDNMDLLEIKELFNSTTDIDELCIFETVMMILHNMEQVCNKHNLRLTSLIGERFDVLG